MTLKKEVITVPIGMLGMNSEEDPKIHQGLIKVKNGLYKRTGSIEKRTGDEQLLSSVSEDKIALYRDLPFLYDDYGKIFSDDKLVTLNERAGFMDVDVNSIAHSRRDIFYYSDIAEAEDVYVVSYIVSDPSSATPYSLMLESFDKNTGTRLDSSTLIADNSDAYMAKVLSLPDDTPILCCYFFDPDDSDYLQNVTINVSTGAISSATRVSGNRKISSDLKNSWDACVISNSYVGGPPYAAVAYRDNANSGTDVITMVNGGSTVSYTAVSNQRFSGTGNVISIGLNSAGYVGYCLVQAELVGGTTTEVYAACGQYPGTLYITAAMVDTYAENPGNTTYSVSCVEKEADSVYHIFIERLRGTTSIPSIRKNVFYSDGGTGTALYGSTANEFKYRAAFAAKPFKFSDGRVIVPIWVRAWGLSLSALYHWLWVDSDSGSVVGKSLLGEFRRDPNFNILMLSNTTETSTDNFITVGVKLIEDDNSNDNRDIFQIMRLDATPDPTTISATDVSKYTYLANSCPYLIDGNSITEQGFIMYPEPFSVVNGTGGGAMDVGTYKYKLVYEWTDAHGNLHESSPSPDYGEVTLAGANDQVTLTMPTLHFTRKENVVIAIYRTTESGTTYYRVHGTTMTTDSDNTIFIDQENDSNITDLKTLYTDSGEIENIQPRPHRVSTIWQKRHLHVDREHEDSWIFYSKEFIEGFGVRDTDVFLLECEPAGGRITALSSLVDKLIIFKNDRIYATEGKGYTDTGGAYNFYTPYLISPSVGCIDQRSIVRVPAGLMFQAQDGIWLLDLSLRLTSLGQPVQEYLEDTTIVGTAKDNERHLVQFFSDGYDMVYDWLRNKWSIWSDREAVAAISTGDEAYWITSDGYLNRDDSSVYTKSQSPTHYPFRIDTGWFSFSGVGGFQRIYKILILAQNIENHTLKVSIGYDYDPVWTDVQSIDSSALQTFDISKYFGPAGDSTYNNQAYVLKVIPSRQKCSAIRISIEDDTQVSPNQAYSISAIAFEVGIKTGIKRMESTRTTTEV